MKKRFLSLLLAVMMFVGVLPANVFAKELTGSPVAWDGTTIDTSWYNTTDTSFTLSNGSQLQGFAQVVSGTASGIAADSFSGKTVTLTNDIDLNNKNFTCVGLYSTAPFAGTFNGNGNKIKNLSITATADYTGALFAMNAGRIENLIIASGNVTSSFKYTAALVGYNGGEVVNCLNNANINSSDTYVGGLVGVNDNCISNCANTGSITNSGTSTNQYLGGITGGNNCYAVNSYNTGAITSANNGAQIGGIAGFNYYMIGNCYNSGNIVSTGSAVGGIVGFVDQNDLSSGNASIFNCYFLKTDTVNSGRDAAGTAIVTNPQAKSIGTAELTDLSDTLDSAFAADTNTINSGYPVLTWQNTGVFADPMKESLEGTNVTGITSVSNGTITVSLDRSLIFTYLSASDFSATVSVNSGTPSTLSFTSILQTGSTVTLGFSEVSQTISNQTVTVCIGYKNGEKKSAGYTLGVSQDWLLYTEKPTGDGSNESPYQLGSAAHLAWFCALVNGRLADGTVANTAACAQLTADIILNSTSGWDNWDQNTQSLRYWTPIGTDSYTGAYKGTFDGQGHVIKGLYINNTARYMVGLFGYCTGTSVIKNVGLESSYVYSYSRESGSYIGGICGHTLGTLSNCYNSATICAKPADSNVNVYVGGVCGWLDWSTSTNCGLINGCFNLGKIQAYGTSTDYRSCPGGICGLCQGKITNSYNLGSVSGLDTGERVGGICGYFMNMSGIGGLYNCYSAGPVMGTANSDNVSSIAGYGSVNGSRCYYLDSMAADTNGTAKCAAAFTDGTVTDLLGSAFITKSFINGGYPCLKWQADNSWGQEELIALKGTAKNELDIYKNPADYRDAQKTELAGAIAAGKAAIDAAANRANVTAALSDAKSVIDAIKTNIQLTAEELAITKETAKSALDTYKNSADYRAAQKTELANAIAAGKAAIDAAADAAGVNTAVNNAKTAMDAIKTNAQLTAEEQAATLEAVKVSAKAELDAYKNPSDYRDAQKAELANAIAAGKSAIDAAADTAGIDAAVNNAKAVIDTIKTDAQLTAVELTAFKETAKASLDTYKNPADYREAQKNELSNAITAGKSAIEEAQNKAAVSAALQQAKAAIDQIKTDAQLTEEEHPTKSLWQMILEFLERVYDFIINLFRGTL